MSSSVHLAAAGAGPNLHADVRVAHEGKCVGLTRCQPSAAGGYACSGFEPFSSVHTFYTTSYQAREECVRESLEMTETLSVGAACVRWAAIARTKSSDQAWSETEFALRAAF